MKKTNTHTHPESGQVIILLTVGIITLLAFFALAVEGGMYYSDRRDAQGTADAAALSAARAICTGEDSTAAAMFVANMNGYDNDNVTNTVTVHNPPIHGSAAGDSDAVEVVVTAVTEAQFIRLVTSQVLENTVYAVAQCGESASGSTYNNSILENSGIIMLNPDSNAFKTSGQAKVKVISGDIFINSSSSTAMTFNGQPNVEAGAINVVGDYSATKQANITPLPTIGAAPFSGSLFPNLVPPDKPSGPCTTVKLSSQKSATIDPGLYCSIKVSGQASLTMNPGTYWIESGDFDLSGQGDMIAEGVFIYMGPSAGSVSITGQGVTRISPQTTGPYTGLTLFQDPANSGTMKIAGQGNNTSVGGTFYLPSARIQTTGQGDLLISAQLIGDNLDVTGQGLVQINFGESVYYHEESPSTTISLTE